MRITFEIDSDFQVGGGIVGNVMEVVVCYESGAGSRAFHLEGNPDHMQAFAHNLKNCVDGLVDTWKHDSPEAAR